VLPGPPVTPCFMFQYALWGMKYGVLLSRNLAAAQRECWRLLFCVDKCCLWREIMVGAFVSLLLYVDYYWALVVFCWLFP